MNKNVKTVLIVALSLFGAGVILFLAAFATTGFNLSRLNLSLGGENNSEPVQTGQIEKIFEDKGQSLEIGVSSAELTVERSSDDMIHLSYSNSRYTYFVLDESDSTIKLTQKSNGSGFFGFWNWNDGGSTVVLSIPDGHESMLQLGSASGEINLKGVSIGGELKIGTASGEINLSDFGASSVEIGAASGDVSLSGLSESTPVSVGTASGRVSAENVSSEKLDVKTVSGDIDLENASGESAEIGSASGGLRLSSADFENFYFESVSGGADGTLKGSSDDYSVTVETVSGRSNIPAGKGKGDRSLTLKSTSGDFDISFTD